VVTKSTEVIVSLKDDRVLGSVRDPLTSVRSRFAAANGREYLLLMEGGTRLVVYEIGE